MDQQKIGAFISECRKEKGLTQAQLAEKLGVTDKSVSRWENGRTMPDMSLYEDICDVLGIQVSELLYGRRLEDQEKIAQGEKSALGIFRTRSALETFGIFTEVLILIGIIITITLTKVLAETPAQMAITMVCGCFVWAFGLVLRVKIRKAINELDKQ